MAEFSKRPEVTVQTMVSTLDDGSRLSPTAAMRILDFGRLVDLIVYIHVIKDTVIFPHIIHPSKYTQGKVHNPTGEGVKAISSQAKNLAAKHKAKADEESGEGKPGPQRHHHIHTSEEHDTKVKEVGSARRNITRKKSDGAAAGGHYNSRNKKQGGHG